VVDLDDRATRVAGRPAIGRLVGGGGVCAGQGETSFVPQGREKLLFEWGSRPCSGAAVGKPWPIGRTFASDSATNLHFDGGIPRSVRHQCADSAPRRRRASRVGDVDDTGFGRRDRMIT
jgi:hypothetical protein